MLQVGVFYKVRETGERPGGSTLDLSTYIIPASAHTEPILTAYYMCSSVIKQEARYTRLNRETDVTTSPEAKQHCYGGVLQYNLHRSCYLAWTCDLGGAFFRLIGGSN